MRQEDVVIVLNVGRTGSTWLSRALGKHPEILDGCECNFWCPFDVQESTGAGRYNISHMHHLHEDEMSQAFLPSPMQLLSEEDVLEIMGKHAMEIFSKALVRAGKEMIVDKSPSNMLYPYSISNVANILPQATYIHLVRDFRAVWDSYKRNMPSYWVSNGGVAKFAGIIRSAYARLHDQFGGIATVRYEDLCEQPLREMRELLGWIGEHASEELLSEMIGDVKTPREIELEPGERVVIEGVLGDLLTQYGYAV